MKRLGALLLVLVLTLSVMPMGAMAAESTVFLLWPSGGGTLSKLVVKDNAEGKGTWTDATDTNSLSGLVVLADATIDSALTVGQLVIEAGKSLTVSPANSGSGNLTVNGTIYFATESNGPGSIVVQNGGTLTVGSTVFETSNNGKITITVSTTNGADTKAAIAGDSSATSNFSTLTSVTSANFDITVANGPVTITNLALDAEDTTITSAVPVTFMGNNTLQGDVDLKGAVNVKGTVVLSATTYTSFGAAAAGKEVTVEGRLDIATTLDSNDKFTAALLVPGGTVNVSTLTTFSSIVNVSANGMINVGSETEFADDLTINGGTVNVNASTTFASAVTVTNNGKLNLKGTITSFENDLNVAGGTVMVNAGDTGTGGASFTNVTITNGGVLDFVKNTGNNAKFKDIDLSGGTMNVGGAIADASLTNIILENGTLNINTTGFNTEKIKGASFTGIMNVNSNLTLGGSGLLVSPSGVLNVADGVTLNLAGRKLDIGGTAHFGTGGKLDADAGAVVTVTGNLYMCDPYSQTLAPIVGNYFKGAGSVYTDNRSWFINGGASVNLKYYNYSSGSMGGSMGGNILVNTPILAPASSVYSGIGHFVINSSGLFKDFDPDNSLYANGVKMTAGVDYEVTDKGGYAVFTIYESFMQAQSGPIVFKAEFKSGFSGSTTVNAQSATIPADITATAPKTGSSLSTMGFVAIAMAIALAVVVRKVKA